MKAIFKYPLVGEELESDGKYALDVTMPVNSRPIRVAVQGSVPTLWAEVETDNELKPHTFSIIGTGREVPDSAKYIGTLEIGSLVWHVYGPAS